MAAQNDTARVTLESLKERNKIPIVQWDSRNVWFVLGAAVIGGFLGRELGLGLVGAIPLAVLSMYLAYDLVRSTPPYYNVTDWLKTNYRYLRRPSKYANTAEAHLETDSTLRAAIETEETTRNLTHVKRFYPPHGIIERSDSSYAMLLRYTPPNMDFATDEEYFRLMNTLAKGYNDVIDFDLSLHATTRPVDMEEYFEQLADRMDDADVENNDIFAALLEEMKDNRRQMLERSNTEIVHFYIIISVDEDEIADVVGGDDEATERSRLFGLLGGRRNSTDKDAEREKERRLQKTLENRAGQVSNLVSGGGRRLEDATIEPVSTTEAAAVLETYWTGRRVPLTPGEEIDPIPAGAMSRGPEKGEDAAAVTSVAELIEE